MSYIIQFAFLQNYLRRNDDFAKLCQTSLESYTSYIDSISWNLNKEKQSKYLQELVNKRCNTRATQLDFGEVFGDDWIIRYIQKIEDYETISAITKYDKEVQVSEAATYDVESRIKKELNVNEGKYCEKLLAENNVLLLENENLKKLLEKNKIDNQCSDRITDVLEERDDLCKLIKKIVKYGPKVIELKNRALKTEKLLTERENLITRLKELSVILQQKKYLTIKCRRYRTERVKLIKEIYYLENSLIKIINLFKNVFDGFKILRNYFNQQLENQENKYEEYNNVIFAMYRNSQETIDQNENLRRDSISYVKKIQSSENEIISLKREIDYLQKPTMDMNLNTINIEENNIEKDENKQINCINNVKTVPEFQEEKNLEFDKSYSCLNDKLKESDLQNKVLELEYNLEQEKRVNDILKKKMQTAQNEFDKMFNQKHQCDEVLKDLMSRFELQSNEIIANFNKNVETLLTVEDKNDKVSLISNNFEKSNNDKKSIVENIETIQEISINNLTTKDEKHEIEIKQLKLNYENQLQELIKNHDIEAKSLRLANKSLKISLGNVKEILKCDNIGSLMLKSKTEDIKTILNTIKTETSKSISEPDHLTENQHLMKIYEICLKICLKGINSLSIEDLKYIHTEICKAGLEKSLGILLEPEEEIGRKCCICNGFVCSIPKLPKDKEITVFNKLIYLEQEIENCIQNFKIFKQYMKFGRSMTSYRINNKVNKIIKHVSQNSEPV